MPQTTTVPAEFDLLGDQLNKAIAFAKMKFDKHAIIYDAVTDEQVSAGELFQKHGTRWFLRPESLPGHLAVKSIAVDKSLLLLETAPLDTDGVQKLIVDGMLPLRYEFGLAFVDSTTDEKLIELRTAKLPEGLAHRWLWAINWRSLQPNRLDAVIRFADAVYTAGAYDMRGIVMTDQSSESSSAGGRLQLRLQLGLQHKLAIEQRPILSLQLKTAGLQTLRTELRPLLALQARILTMNPDQLIDFVAENASREGVQKTLQILRFVIAGRVKAAQPELTWKAARVFARRMTSGK